MTNSPLVSVIIVTYNSSGTILETLDSVRNQDYNNIELIVSDDHSSDNTIQVCNDWINTYKDRFLYCKIVTSPKNTGVTANVNRGWRACHGEWVKILGGDDLFLPHAISEVMNFVSSEKEIIVSQYNEFTQEQGKIQIGELHPKPEIKVFYDEIDAEKRKKIILHTFIDATIGYFIRRRVLEKVGGFDEDFPMFEDAPMFFKLTYLGYRFYLLEKPCFLYRISESITHPSSEKVYNIRFKESSLLYHRKIVNKHIPCWNIIYHQAFWMAFIQFHLIVKLAHNRSNKLSRFIKTLVYYLTIDTYIKKIKGNKNEKN